MDYEYLQKEIKRYEALWDKEFNNIGKAIGKAQRWHWKGLDEGFKFAMKTIEDIIKHGEIIEKLINKMSNLEIKKLKEKQEIERKAKIKVLKEVIKKFNRAPNEEIEINIRTVRNIFIDLLLGELKKLEGEAK